MLNEEQFPTMKPIGLERAENRDSSKETYETYDKKNRLFKSKSRAII